MVESEQRYPVVANLPDFMDHRLATIGACEGVGEEATLERMARSHLNYNKASSHNEHPRLRK